MLQYSECVVASQVAVKLRKKGSLLLKSGHRRRTSLDKKFKSSFCEHYSSYRSDDLDVRIIHILMRQNIWHSL